MVSKSVQAAVLVKASAKDNGIKSPATVIRGSRNKSSARRGRLQTITLKGNGDVFGLPAALVK
jgi:hypothetical protein